MRLSKQETEALLSTVNGGVWTVKDLRSMGPIRLGEGFLLVARMTGCCVNYFLVPVIRRIVQEVKRFSPLGMVRGWVSKVSDFIRGSWQVPVIPWRFKVLRG